MVVGYVLLIVFVVFLGVVVYNWMKTYVPKGDLNCPEGTSLFIKDYNCTTNNQLNLTLKNNGKFNVGGYFIRVTNTSGVGLATIDLSKNITSGEDFLSPTGVKFGGAENSLLPNYDAIHVFDISDYTNIYSVEIVPIRWQEEERRKRLVSCKTSIIRENLICT